jgi:hypothetical protein
MRTRDASRVVGASLMSVYGRELAWDFVKGRWQEMSVLYGQSGLGRVCQGSSGLSTPNWPVM